MQQRLSGPHLGLPLQLLVTWSPGTSGSPTPAGIHRAGGGRDSHVTYPEHGSRATSAFPGRPPPYPLPSSHPLPPPQPQFHDPRQQQQHGERDPLSAGCAPRLTGRVGHAGRDVAGGRGAGEGQFTSSHTCPSVLG